MAFGTVYNNNQAAKNSDPGITVYSYRMNNAESDVDQTCLNFRFWKNSLCISIYPRKQTGNDEISFDMDNGVTIYLSHTKARMLKSEIEFFMKDPVKYSSVGVSSGSAAITLSNGAEYGKNAPFITIRKLSENGEIVGSFAYEFKVHYHFALRNFDGKNFDREYDAYDNLELLEMLTVLDEFAKASTNAVAFTVMDQRRFSFDRMDKKVDAIAQALGVETAKSYTSGSKGARNSYFNNLANGNSTGSTGSSNFSSGVSYGSATMEDLE